MYAGAARRAFQGDYQKMKAELTLSTEFIDAIGDKVIEKLKPIIGGNSKHEDDVILDVNGLAGYLRVSKQWLYERTHLKEIPHLKIDGQLRFKKRDIDKWLNTFNVPALPVSERIVKVLK
jgi:excisionase family DNA binding protein